MDPQHRLQLANRSHLGLVREPCQGIDVKQLLGNALQARDVLVVCQGYPGTELQRLGHQLREASADHTRRATRPGGFGLSKPAASCTYPGCDPLADSPPDTHPPARRWLTPSSCLAR